MVTLKSHTVYMAQVARQREEALQRAVAEAQTQWEAAAKAASSSATRATTLEEELARVSAREAAAASELGALRGQGDVREAYARLQQSFAKLQGECRQVFHYVVLCWLFSVTPIGARCLICCIKEVTQSEGRVHETLTVPSTASSGAARCVRISAPFSSCCVPPALHRMIA